MSTPKVSVIMSVYKKENPIYLNYSLKSIWDDQVFKPYEIILIIDGALTIQLDELILKWKTKLKTKLILVNKKKNLGLTKSLNKGLLFCRGDYIARMDSDDISTPSRFKLQVDFLEENKNIDVLGAAMQEFNEEIDCLNVRKYPKTNKEILKQIPISCPLCHPSVMFRRNIFDEGNFYNEKYVTSQDIEMWYSLLTKGYKLGNLDDILLMFRMNKDVAKRRSFKKGINEFKIYFTGIINLFGFSYKLVFPFIRLTTRLMPPIIINLIYKSSLRNIFNPKS